jgi:hypothetical protein
MVVCVGCLEASLRVLSLTFSSDSVWVSKNPGDLKTIEHLAETTLHKNTPLQNWDTLSQEQTNKLTEESQKTKPSLANHHQDFLIAVF